jgi:hypothetical protein|tara:strand:+ start:1076 stop:1567 length:492 start_codon:yes stop_codon:yes gene_type:complete
MKVKAVIKKIKTHFKKQGIDIDVEYNGTRWSFQHNDYVGSFLANGAMASDTAAQLEADACNFHVRRCDDYSDMQSDYFAGSFRDNASQMIEALLPKPAKFKVGQLVKGKSNKRAVRQGYAGKVGLVMAEGGHGFARVAWTGDKTKHKTFGWPTFPERDLEVAT